MGNACCKSKVEQTVQHIPTRVDEEVRFNGCHHPPGVTHEHPGGAKSKLLESDIFHAISHNRSESEPDFLIPSSVNHGLDTDNQPSSPSSSSPYKSNSAVKVAVMVRPLLDFEAQKGSHSVVTVSAPNKVRLPSKTYAIAEEYNFQFDRVYSADSKNAGRNLYSEMVTVVIDKFCQGFNGTVLAYGQTGSGKTYTMGTNCGLKEFSSPQPSAVIPCALQHLFKHIDSARAFYDVVLRVSYVEIYNEHIQDLLAPPGTAASRVSGAGGGVTISGASCSQVQITVREQDGEMILENATEVVVRSREQLVQLLEQGNAQRATAAHRMNSESSRSHAIVSLRMEQDVLPAAMQQVERELHFLRSKLHLVDLAGSERVKETGATGQRMNEGISINKGLLELGNVIKALTEGTARKHIPYRNSKLTRVLQDSLGGNSETLFIACVSPADSNHDHTLSTLRYASRAMRIQNSLSLNNSLSPEEEIEYLKRALALAQAEAARYRAMLERAGIEA